jgi:hypothetical protein
MITSRKRKRGITAWLVTWDHVGEHAQPPRPIAAVLSRRWGADRVAQIVELLYANEYYSISERIAYAGESFNPYPARRGTLYGVPWDGEICCGHNPFLYARLVDNLRTEGEDDADVRWVEREKPNVPVLERSRE